MRAAHFGPEAWRPLAEAWLAYTSGEVEAQLEVHADDGEMEVMPVAIFFRGRDGLREADREALSRVRGRVLDGGAGVGSLSLVLQAQGVPVTALEVIPEGVAVMRERGVLDSREGRLEDLPSDGAYDTILLLMNGSALAGTLEGFPPFLKTLEGLLAPGGQVLMDSTDLNQGEPALGAEELEAYPGELQYQMVFEGIRGAPFPQLFMDPDTLKGLAEGEGWGVELLWTGESGEYLVRLTR